MESELCVTKLVPDDRAKRFARWKTLRMPIRVVHNMIIYGFERPFSTAAIEVSYHKKSS